MPQLLLGDILRQAAMRSPSKIAASIGDRRISFRDLADLVDRTADALLDVGLGKGDRIAWQSETSIEAIAANFGAARIGAIFVPINPKASSEERERLVAHSSPAIRLGDTESGWMPLADLLARHGEKSHLLPDVSEWDDQVIYYTSGTTGYPKGCLLSHRVQMLRSLKGSPWTSRPTVMMFPQFHMAGWAQPIEAWLRGTQVVYATSSEADDLIEAIESNQAELLYCIPAVWKRILNSGLQSRNLRCLRNVETGTSLVTAELLESLASAFPDARLSVAYGSTEAGMISILDHENAFRKAGSVGRPAGGVSVRIDDDGVLLASSPWLFERYFGDEGATQAAFRNGWYVTGDLAECDDDGFYSIVGRAGDLIRSGGETIAPAEIEAVLQMHPAVGDVAVVGLPDETWGEIVTALVVPKPGETVQLPQLRAVCQDRIAPHKHPRQLVIVDALPRTGATRQIQRGQLRSLAADFLGR